VFRKAQDSKNESNQQGNPKILQSSKIDKPKILFRISLYWSVGIFGAKEIKII